MKQTLLYLLKGLLFSTLLMTLSVLFLAFLMMKTGWNDSVMFPLLIVFFCLASFIGGRYFAKHAQARRFLWGIAFGGAFFAVYLTTAYFLSSDAPELSGNTLTFLAAGLGAGCIGGMLS